MKAFFLPVARGGGAPPKTLITQQLQSPTPLPHESF